MNVKGEIKIQSGMSYGNCKKCGKGIHYHPAERRFRRSYCKNCIKILELED